MFYDDGMNPESEFVPEDRPSYPPELTTPIDGVDPDVPETLSELDQEQDLEQNSEPIPEQDLEHEHDTPGQGGYPTRRYRFPRRSTPEGEHVPVMLSEVLETMGAAEGGVYVDCTLGLGGHTSALLKRAGPHGFVIGIDFDPAALTKAQALLSPLGSNFQLFQGNYAGIQENLGQAGFTGCDGLLADLGMSSFQLDNADRGFSYRRDGPLDMRMDPTRGRTAAELLATIDEKDLVQALSEIGDEPDPWGIARKLIAQREIEPITRTGQLAALLEENRGGAPWKLKQGRKKWESHPAIRVFQTLRILVNRELGNLEHLLRMLPEILNPGGTAVILSFHSGEDRLVKKSFWAGLESGKYEAISPDPIRPTFFERQTNPRSRSTKLRWARKR